MSEPDLLRDVVDRPDEDAPRLALADWLAEHGESERAEFIRVQCELAAGVSDPVRRRQLDVREATLWHTHKQSWVKELLTCARKGAEYRRGFAFTVTVTPDELLEQGDTLFQQAPIRGLRLNVRTAERFDELLASPHFRTLTSLYLHGVTPAHAAVLTTSPNLAGLTTLDVHGERPIEWLRDLLASKHLAGLTAFGVCGQRSTWKGRNALRDFLQLPTVSRLKSLNLAQTRLNGFDALLLAKASIRPSELVLAGCPKLLQIGLSRLLGPFLSAAARLDLSACDVTDVAWMFLDEKAVHLSKLVELNLSGNPEITLRSLRELVTLPHLSELLRVEITGTVAAQKDTSGTDRYPDGRVIFWTRKTVPTS